MKTPSPMHERRWTTWLALVPLLGACAAAPDLKGPELPMASSYKAPSAPPAEVPTDSHTALDSGPPDAGGWELFGSPTLNAYLTQLLKRNATLEAAEQALAIAQALAAAQNASVWPTVQAAYSPTRTKLAGNQGGNSPGIQGDGRVISTQSGTPAAAGGEAPFNHPVIYNFHTAQVSVAYTLDAFGGNRHQRQSLQAQADASRWQLSAARAALVTQAIAAAVQDGLLREQIAQIEAQLAIQRRSTDMLRSQVAQGQVSGLELTQQLLQETQLQQSLPALKRQQAQNADALRAMAGWAPDHPLPAFQLLDFKLTAPQGVPLPSQLLERRPDVMAAQAQLRVAEAGVGTAHAARLPQFMLTANWGGAAASPAQMLWQGGRFFDITANLVAPLFDAGAGAQREAAAAAQWRQSAALYRAAALQALQDVADSLHALESDRQSLLLADQSCEQADRLARMADEQLAAGYIDRLAWGQAQMQKSQAQSQKAQVRAAWLTDLAALLQALGGSWPSPQESPLLPLHPQETP